MAAETQYTANTGVVAISTANSNLDGTGTLGTVLTAGSNGSLIKRIFLKAQGSVTQGMIRLFVTGGGNTRLIQEIEVPTITPSATDPSFEFVWECNYKLQSGYVLKASTQNAETFNVVAEGLDWNYFAAYVRPESTNYTANTGMNLMTAANPNRDGTGTLYTAITAGSSGSYKGCRIDSITLKAIVNTTHGMLRLYIYNNTTAFLFKEVFVPYVTASTTDSTFEKKIFINLELQAGYALKGSTENAESCVVIAEGNDWNYPGVTMSDFTPISNTGTTSEEILHALQVPANMFAVGDLIQVYAATASSNNSNSKTFKIYVNTANSLTSAVQVAQCTFSNVASGSISRFLPVISNTALEAYGGTGLDIESQYVSNSGTSANVTVPSISAGFYILITGQKAVLADTNTVRWSMVTKVF